MGWWEERDQELKSEGNGTKEGKRKETNHNNVKEWEQKDDRERGRDDG